MHIKIMGPETRQCTGSSRRLQADWADHRVHISFISLANTDVHALNKGLRYSVISHLHHYTQTLLHIDIYVFETQSSGYVIFCCFIGKINNEPHLEIALYQKGTLKF